MGLVRATQRDGLEILDRVGGGDSFASGLISGLLAGEPLATAVEYGAAHGALAMTTPGDTSMASAAEVLELAGVAAPASTAEPRPVPRAGHWRNAPRRLDGGLAIPGNRLAAAPRDGSGGERQQGQDAGVCTEPPPEVSALAINVVVPEPLRWTDTRRGDTFELTTLNVRLLPDGHLAAKAYGRPVGGGRGGYVPFAVPGRPEIAALISDAASRAGDLWSAHRGLPGREA
jgi:hypothetical protein